jgi:hypothetical protein
MGSDEDQSQDFGLVVDTGPEVQGEKEHLLYINHRQHQLFGLQISDRCSYPVDLIALWICLSDRALS